MKYTQEGKRRVIQGELQQNNMEFYEVQIVYRVKASSPKKALEKLKDTMAKEIKIYIGQQLMGMEII